MGPRDLESLTILELHQAKEYIDDMNKRAKER